MTFVCDAWVAGSELAAFTPEEMPRVAARIRETAHLLRESRTGRVGVGFGGRIAPASMASNPTYVHLASLPPMYPEWLGDRAFVEAHGLALPYVAGAMANGIASPQMVIALAREGMLGILGTAGLSIAGMEERLDVMERELGPGHPGWAANLIHSPQEPALEMQTVELFLRRGVRRVCAAAFMTVTEAVVLFVARGLRQGTHGQVERHNHLFAKISHPDVATRFMAPAPPELLGRLVDKGLLSSEEARLAAHVPVAQDLTVEGDSGGHTDNRPLAALFPVIAQVRDRAMATHGYAVPVRLGAAGGMGTPQAVAAAFAMGAAYVMTGSINQASLEAAQSAPVKELLGKATLADVAMAPAGDMFELGAKVQVLRRGSFFAQRARRLHEIYASYGAIEALETDVRGKLEREIFQKSLDEVWDETRQFFERRNPEELERAIQDPRHKLALVCRWYLGLSSRWAIEGLASRRMDYQVWMGPAQGAFNEWVRGSFLEPVEARGVAQMALNLMEGAAVVTRAAQLRSYGVAMPPAAFAFVPRPLQRTPTGGPL